MKKILFGFAALAAGVACTQTSVVYEDTAEIGIAPVNYTITKAHQGAITGTSYPTDEEFGLLAFHTTGDAGTAIGDVTEPMTTYLDDVRFVYLRDGIWHGAPSYYWPKTGSLFFAGYSPAGATKTDVSYSFDDAAEGLTIDGFVQGDYNYVVENNNMVDLLWFDCTPVSYNTGAPEVTFRHALSYITLAINTNIEEGLFTLKKVTLKGVDFTGTFTSSDLAWTGSNSKDITVFEGTQAVVSEAFKLDNILVIPQGIDAKCLELVYEQLPYAGATSGTITNTQSLDLTGGDTAGDNTDKWLIGKHYTYNICFTAEEITLKPSVEAWEEMPAGNIEL